jgi:hypothetical protein
MGKRGWSGPLERTYETRRARSEKSGRSLLLTTYYLILTNYYLAPAIATAPA